MDSEQHTMKVLSGLFWDKLRSGMLGWDGDEGNLSTIKLIDTQVYNKK